MKIILQLDMIIRHEQNVYFFSSSNFSKTIGHLYCETVGAERYLEHLGESSEPYSTMW